MEAVESTDWDGTRRTALEDLVHNLPAMVAYWDATLRCRFANRAYETFFGVTAEAMVGRDMKEFLGPLFELNRPYIEGALRGVEQQFEREIPDPKGGPPRFTQAHYVPHVVDGTVRGFYVLVADITARRQAEQTLHKMERQLHANERLAAVAMLAAGTSHELNNPLAAVLANAELGLEHLGAGGHDPELLHATLVDVRDAARRARDILRNMATLARGDATTRELVDLEAVIDTSLQLATPVIRYDANVVRERGAVAPVLANPAQLVQVFVNLLINASQAFSDETSERNEIRVVSRRDAGRVLVEVHDNGRGIPEELQARIFEPFFSTRDVGGGIGIGLSIATAIVRSFGGTITVRSRVGSGSVFEIALPEAPDTTRTSAEPTPTDVRAAETRPSPGRPRILIIDDEVMITRTLQRSLAREFDVVAVNDGPAGLAIIDTPTSVDLVMCDLMMPGMTGQEVYAEAVKVRPHLRRRFVIMTGGAFTARGQEFLATVEAPIVKKPFDVSEVRELLRRIASQ